MQALDCRARAQDAAQDLRDTLQKKGCVDKTVDHGALMVARNTPRWMRMLVKNGFVPTPA